MSMRKRKARVGIKNLGARARTKRAREAAKASTSSNTEDVNQPTRPLTFLEAYESAQKRISDLASHRERVLAEITQPATLKDVPRPYHQEFTTKPIEETEAGSSATAAVLPVPTEPLPEVTPIPTTVRTSARLRSRRSEATSDSERHNRTHEPVTERPSAKPSDSVPPPEMDDERIRYGSEEEGEEASVSESDEENEELIAMRRRVNEMGDGLIQAGKLLQEQAWTADANWIMETLKRADRPGSSGELHAILFSRSIKRS